jgi:hypothetical protein
MADVIMAMKGLGLPEAEPGKRGRTQSSAAAAQADNPPKKTKEKGEKEKGDKDKVEEKGKPFRKARKDDSRSYFEALLMQVIKFTLINSKDIREIKSALVEVMLFNIEDDDSVGYKVQEQVKAATAAYSAHAKTLTPSQRASHYPPHIFAWHALATAATTVATETNHPALVELKQYFKVVSEKAKTVKEEKDFKDKTMEVAVREVYLRFVKIAKVNKCWAQSLNKVELCAMDEAMPAATAILQVLNAHAKGQYKRGSAPRGDLERRLMLALSKNDAKTEE